MTFGTFDQSDEETWPDQKRSTYLHTYISIREHPKGAIIGTCDIWDTDYNTDNWEPGFMTIFVTWQLIVTLDSIRNSCDVLFISPVVVPLASKSKRLLLSIPIYLLLQILFGQYLYLWTTYPSSNLCFPAYKWGSEKTERGEGWGRGWRRRRRRPNPAPGSTQLHGRPTRPPMPTMPWCDTTVNPLVSGVSGQTVIKWGPWLVSHSFMWYCSTEMTLHM